MPGLLDVSTPATRFRLVAVAEAVSWGLLLVAMFFKWVLDAPGEGGVPVVGPIHGAMFVAYLVVTLWVARPLQWGSRVTLLALAASVPPFGSVIFERWAARRGHLAELSTGGRLAQPV